MLYTRKNTTDYHHLAEKVIDYAEKSGYEDIKADFTGYDSPSSLKMVNTDLTLTPDFSAKKGDAKYYFELVLKNKDNTDENQLISKWKALETIAKMKGGELKLFVPHGSFKYASQLVQDNGIEAKLTKMTKLEQM